VDLEARGYSGFDLMDFMPPGPAFDVVQSSNRAQWCFIAVPVYGAKFRGMV